MRQLAERHRRHRGVQALRRGERRHACRRLRAYPELVVEALNELQARPSFHVSFPKTLSCSYVLGSVGSVPGWLS